MKKKRILIYFVIEFFCIGLLTVQIMNIFNFSYKTSNDNNKIFLSSPDSIIFEGEWELPNSSWGTTYAIKVNTSGDIYLAGYNNNKATVFKLNSTLTLQWNLSCSPGEYNIFRDLTFDNSGNIYLIGHTYSSNNWDILLVKYNYNGVFQWSRIVGKDEGDEGYGITSDSNENVYITGSTKSFSYEESDIFLIKYDKNGLMLWNRTFGWPLDDIGYVIKIDSSNNILVGGSSGDPTSGARSLCLAKISDDNDMLWMRTYGSAEGWEDCYDINIDSNDNIYAAGTLGDDLLVAKFNSDGNQLWNRTWGLNGNDNGYGITLDSFNNVYICGNLFLGSLPYDDSKACLVKFDNNGSYIGNYTWGFGGMAYSFSIEYIIGNIIYLVCHQENVGEENWTWIVKCALDNDEDGLSDWREMYIHATNPLDTDTDNDGLSDGEEVYVYFTNPTNIDTDGDNMPDRWEVINYLDPLRDDSFMDHDNDGLTNLEEYQNNTNPFDSDTDNDGFSDGEEVNKGFDPLNKWDNLMMNIVKIGLIITIVFVSITILLSYRHIKRKRIKKLERERIEMRKRKEEKLKQLELEKQEIVVTLKKKIAYIEKLIMDNNYLAAIEELVNIKLIVYTNNLDEIKGWLENRLILCKKVLVKTTILDLSIKFKRLELAEIEEKSGVKDEEMIPDIINEMIENKEIHGEYFSSSKALMFDQQANIDEIDKLMKTYREWEEEEFGKKI